MPGINAATGQARLTFGITEMNDGFQLLPVLIGLFAVNQIFRDIMNVEQLLILDARLEGGFHDGRWYLFLDSNNQRGLIGSYEADGAKFIINAHSAAEQIWMAAGTTAWHFDYVAERGRWIASKTNEELMAVLQLILKSPAVDRAATAIALANHIAYRTAPLIEVLTSGD